MPNNPQKSLPTQRRNELLNAIDSVVDKDNTDNKEGLRELLRTTAWMENTLGHNPNAYGRTYTNGPMSLDDIAYKDLFSPIKDKNGVSTGRFSEYQRKILNKLKEFGYSDLATFTDSLKSDDPLASVLAARFYYGLNPAPIPEAKDRQSMFNYYKDNYNKGGMAKYQDDETALNRFNSYYDSELNQPSVSLINTEEQPDLRQIDNAAPAVSTHVDMGQVRDIDFSTQEGSVKDISQGNKIDISDSVDPQTLEAQPIKMAAGGSAGGMMSIVNQMNFDQIGEQAISSQASGTSKMGVDPYSMGANILSTGIDAFAKPKGDYGGANDTAKYDGARQAVGQGLTMVNPIAGAAYQVGTSIGGAFRSGNEDKVSNQVAADLFNPSEGIFRAIEEKDASYAIPFYGGIKAAKDAQEELKKREAIESAANFTANEESQATVLGRSNQRQSNAATPKRFMANGGPTNPPESINYIKPTYADSLALYHNAIEKHNFYNNNPDYKKSNYKSGTDFLNSKTRKELIKDAKKREFDTEILDMHIRDFGVSPSYKGEKRFKDIPNTGLTQFGDILDNLPDSYFNPEAPPIFLHPSISPQGSDNFWSDKFGDASDIPNYVPLAVAPWEILSEKQKEERVKKFGLQGSPFKSIEEFKNRPEPKVAPKIKPEVKPKVTKINPKKGDIPIKKLKQTLQGMGKKIPTSKQQTIYQSDPTTETGQYPIGERYWDNKSKRWIDKRWSKEEQNASKKLVTKNIKSKVQFANGGLLDGFSETKDIKGRSHAQGGVPMGKDIEVEGGEVRHKNFIFTNRF